MAMTAIDAATACAIAIFFSVLVVSISIAQLLTFAFAITAEQLIRLILALTLATFFKGFLQFFHILFELLELLRFEISEFFGIYF